MSIIIKLKVQQYDHQALSMLSVHMHVRPPSHIAYFPSPDKAKKEVIIVYVYIYIYIYIYVCVCVYSTRSESHLHKLSTHEDILP